MEVGSRAGYYTSKSPKMILHEWCNRANRPKPRYKAIATDDGRYRCKVLASLLCSLHTCCLQALICPSFDCGATKSHGAYVTILASNTQRSAWAVGWNVQPAQLPHVSKAVLQGSAAR